MGNPVSDALEIAALDRVFGGGSPGTATCQLGAVAGNVGHLDSAAGMAGLIKAILMVERGLDTAAAGLPYPGQALASTPDPVRGRGLGGPTVACAPGGAGQPHSAPLRGQLVRLPVAATPMLWSVRHRPHRPSRTLPRTRRCSSCRREMTGHCGGGRRRCVMPWPPAGLAIARRSPQAGPRAAGRRHRRTSRTPCKPAGHHWRAVPRSSLAPEAGSCGVWSRSPRGSPVRVSWQRMWKPSSRQCRHRRRALGIHEAASWELIARRWLAGEHIDLARRSPGSAAAQGRRCRATRLIAAGSGSSRNVPEESRAAGHEHDADRRLSPQQPRRVDEH